MADPFAPPGSPHGLPKPKKRGHKNAVSRQRQARRPRDQGPEALRPRNERSLRRQATRTVGAAYAPMSREVDVREEKAKALYDSQQQAEGHFQNWLMGQQAQMQASAAQADAAVRQNLVALRMEADARLSAAQQQAQAQPQTAEGADQYQAKRIGLAREEAFNTSAAGENRVAAQQTAGNLTSRALGESTLAAGQARRSKSQERFYEEMRNVAESRKDIGLRRAGDVEKMITDLQQRELGKAEKTRDFEAVMQELGIKGFQARVEARQGAQKLKLDRAEYLRKLNKDQLDNALKRTDQALKARDLGRKERDSLERRRHNIQTEINARTKGTNKSRSLTQAEQGASRNIVEGRTLAIRAVQNQKIPNFRKSGAIERWLRARGYSPLEAQAAEELVLTGRVSQSTRRLMKDSGYSVPKNWR